MKRKEKIKDPSVGFQDVLKVILNKKKDKGKRKRERGKRKDQKGTSKKIITIWQKLLGTQTEKNFSPVPWVLIFLKVTKQKKRKKKKTDYSWGEIRAGVRLELG